MKLKEAFHSFKESLKASTASSVTDPQDAKREVPEAADEDPDNEHGATKPGSSVKASINYGDEDFDEAEDLPEATWNEVYRTCCCHSPKGWFMIFLGTCLVCGILYFFILGLELLSTAAKVLTGCSAGNLFADTNPVAGVMVGILATVLLQSSSTTTSIVVSLVGSGLDVQAAIYIIMGANIGTSVTNTLVAMGQMGDGDQLERAFAGATVHDMFNYLSVLILCPVEAATGYLYYLTRAMVKNVTLGEEGGETWESPIAKMLAPIVDSMIISNKKIITAVAEGTSCTDPQFYPTFCEGGIESYETCTTVGLIKCNSANNKCPAFFNNGAVKGDDVLSGGICLFIALIILVGALLCLVYVLQKILLGSSQRIIYKTTNVNGYLAMAIGCVLTMFVQSSSVVTSTLTPLVGLDVLRLEQMFPLTLGANIGTTLTGFLAAMVSANTNSLQVALAHLFFNITGILIWYPIPFMRKIPLGLARNLGKATRIYKLFPLIYIGVAFFLFPLLCLGLSMCFTQDSTGLATLGIILLIFLILGSFYFIYWWRCKDGSNKTYMCFVRKERKRVMMNALPDTLEQIHADLGRIKEAIGMGDDIEEENEEVKALLPSDTTKEVTEKEVKVAAKEEESEFFVEMES